MRKYRNTKAQSNHKFKKGMRIHKANVSRLPTRGGTRL